MTDQKERPKWKVLQPLERFTEGKTQCEVCRKNKQTYREKHREILREKLEINKEYSKQMTECSACKVMIQKCKMKRHEQTGTHLHNLNHPNNLKLTYKQQHEQKQKQQEQQQKQLEEEKEARRKDHQKTVAYLNENLPTYPCEQQTEEPTQEKTLTTNPFHYLIQSPWKPEHFWPKPPHNHPHKKHQRQETHIDPKPKTITGTMEPMTSQNHPF